MKLNCVKINEAKRGRENERVGFFFRRHVLCKTIGEDNNLVAAKTRKKSMDIVGD